MSYVLLLSFEYYRYRHDAIIRIFADDRLINEFSLDKDIKLKTVNVKGFPLSRARSNLTPVVILPTKLFLLHINEEYLDDRIRIEVENNASNYTNGFMTDYSYVDFHQILLFPSCLLEKHNWNSLDRFDTLKTPNGDRFPRLPDFKDAIVKSMTKSWSEDLFFHKRGGSFTLDIPIYKKHKIRHLGKLLPGKVWANIDLARMLWVFDTLNTSI